MRDEITERLEALKAKLDEHEAGGKTLEQTLHGAISDIYAILAALEARSA